MTLLKFGQSEFEQFLIDVNNFVHSNKLHHIVVQYGETYCVFHFMKGNDNISSVAHYNPIIKKFAISSLSLDVDVINLRKETVCHIVKLINSKDYKLNKYIKHLESVLNMTRACE